MTFSKNKKVLFQELPQMYSFETLGCPFSIHSGQFWGPYWYITHIKVTTALQSLQNPVLQNLKVPQTRFCVTPVFYELKSNF